MVRPPAALDAARRHRIAWTALSLVMMNGGFWPRGFLEAVHAKLRHGRIELSV